MGGDDCIGSVLQVKLSIRLRRECRWVGEKEGGRESRDRVGRRGKEGRRGVREVEYSIMLYIVRMLYTEIVLERSTAGIP